MYIVSACLAGFNTRFDGTNRLEERVRRLVMEGRAIPVCPEQLAGLSTPRPPIGFYAPGGERSGAAVLDGKAKALSEEGTDCSAALVKGAEEVLSIAGLYGVWKAVLKDGSPSCGVTYIHSGGVGRTPGMGITTALLVRAGIKVMTVAAL
jgi:uncharacterized protein YbbK (DUF523 family)